MTEQVIYNNDNNIRLYLTDHKFTNTFRTRTNHEVIFRRINTLLILKKIIKNNVIDLGCWIGDNSIPWAKNMNKSIVYAIDPSDENCEYIHQMCNANSISNVKVIKKAISDKCELLSTNDDLHHCSFVYGNTGTTGKNRLESVSLDFLYKSKEIDNIGYIHLDVEGMEFKVIRGSENIINIFKPVITFEQHLNIDDYKSFSEYLADKGYNVFIINEILPGCRLDCRNFIAFHNEIFQEHIINEIHSYLDKVCLERIS